MEVGDVDVKAERVEVDIEDSLTEQHASNLVTKAPQDKQK